MSAADESVGEAATIDGVTVARSPSTRRGVGDPKSGESGARLVVDVEPASIEERGFGERYEPGALLGEGGMGEVRLCRDRRIGREVAIKLIRKGHGSRSDARARFEREARVQGQLEHPSVVPVYDLGVEPDGSAYFTMKRVRGKTLDAVLHALASDHGETTRTWSRRKLLAAFSNVCLATAFAHSRGVIHRDLKPANVMLGEFGEVHVLDWGVAKLSHNFSDRETLAVAKTESIEATDARIEDASSEGVTIDGDVLGTPGYMAPEQVRGEQEAIDARTDVYALGVILFEILTLESLFRREPVDAFAATLVLDGAVPSSRAREREIPPELDAICARATRLHPEDRFASARELSEAIEQFLDGDRDVEKRRELAEAHALAAVEAAARATHDRGHPDAAKAALREAVAALAIAPDHPIAMATLVRVLTEAPREMSAEARAAFESEQTATQRASRNATLYAYIACATFLPMALLLGPRDLVAMSLGFAVSLIAVFTAWLSVRGKLGDNGPFITYCVGLFGIAAAAMFAGWAIIVPGMTGIHTAGAYTYGDRRRRKIALALGVLPVLAPFALGALGVTRASYSFEAGRMIVNPWMTELPATMTQIALLLSAIVVILAPTIVLGNVRRAHEKAEERMFMHAWQLRQLVPDAAHDAALPPPPSSVAAPCFAHDRRAVS